LVPEIINYITLILTAFYGFVILYLIRGWYLLKTSIPKSLPHTSVSVLIAARNEENNIGLVLKDILNQNFPAHLLEVIVVDDHSTDNTAEIVRSFSSQGVRLIQLNEKEPLNSYKKKAISEAINYASGELIIATDADCRMKSMWLDSLVSMYEKEDLLFISGPVMYHNERNLFERLQTLEFLYLIGLGAASIGNKKASTCNGANLAYKRDIFLELDGFKGIDEVASGDDELFLHKVAEKYPNRVGFCRDQNAIVYTEAKESLVSFLNQRKRWASKSTKYKNKSIVVFGICIWLFNVFLVISALSALVNPSAWKVVYYCLSFKVLMELVFLLPISRFARRSTYLIYLPFLSLIHIFYLIFIGIAGNSGKYLWKGRMVR
jgi:cellulose synthase/poly-beta-1,6-N-acetylglucosamine synthase-like glycosyltransferase